MAVVQISRIQHRRGLQENLPNLASAELGWSVDSRRLFIGNGGTEEGSPPAAAGRRTEILTENSRELILELLNIYQFKGLPTGFVAQTGSTSLDFVERSLQEKLDDFVNVRDFGAVGDGITDDTDAINRALNNTYAYSNFLTGTLHHRTIHFPAGKYLISDTLRVPPFIMLQGEGKLSTIIEGNIDAPLLRLFDSAGQSENDFGSAVGLIETRGSDYSFHDIGFSNLHIGNHPCVAIDGGQGISFNKTSFWGFSAASDAGNGAVTVNNVSDLIPASNIFFNQCDFINHRYAIKTLDDVNAVSMTQCYFSHLYESWNLSQETTAFSLRDGVFDNITSDGIDYTGATIEGNRVSIAGQKATLNNNVSVGSEISLPAAFGELTIRYTMTRGAGRRTGVWRMTGSGSILDDEYTENSDIGVTVSRSSGDLIYNTTNLGSDVAVAYSLEFYLPVSMQFA